MWKFVCNSPSKQNIISRVVTIHFSFPQIRKNYILHPSPFRQLSLNTALCGQTYLGSQLLFFQQIEIQLNVPHLCLIATRKSVLYSPSISCNRCQNLFALAFRAKYHIVYWILCGETYLESQRLFFQQIEIRCPPPSFGCN